MLNKLILLVVWGVIMTSVVEAKNWETHPDTWVATDALGRSVPMGDKVGPPRPGKFVGIFYFLWLGQHGVTGPHDITNILAKDPDAMKKPDSPLWGPSHAFHHWGKSLFGYYLSDDRWVLRKHAQMLSDAGVDVVIFDVTNQATYKNNYTALCEVWSQVRKEGGRTPQIAFLTPFWDPPKVVQELYDDFYSKGSFRDLWFQWKGKPLILADPNKVAVELKGFFTYRKPQPSYFEGPTGPDQWGWLERYPQHIFYNSNNEPEQMTVGIGQNTEGTRCCAMSEADTFGRSWHSGKKDMRPGAINLGLNVQEQWERALKIDPEFIFITGWNEWVALRLNEFAGVKEPVMFVDTFTQEYSRDIEPMTGGHGDNYYYQMVDYIRRFKGATKPPKAGRTAKLKMDGSFSDWADVKPDYRDDVGDTMHRDHLGWGSQGRYINITGRNDIMLSKVACDSKNVFFYVKTKEPITPCTDPNWMMLLIRLKGDDIETGWNGYRFIVNRQVRDSTTSCIEESTGGWNWRQIQKINYRVKGSEMELAVPRSIFGTALLEFDFKWVDNSLLNGDVMEVYTNGDTAPNGRFAYRFIERTLGE